MLTSNSRSFCPSGSSTGIAEMGYHTWDHFWSDLLFYTWIICISVLLLKCFSCYLVSDNLFLNPKDMKLHYGDLTDSTCLVKIINEVKPTEIYNLGAQSHVKVSFSHCLCFSGCVLLVSSVHHIYCFSIP